MVEDTWQVRHVLFAHVHKHAHTNHTQVDLAVTNANSWVQDVPIACGSRSTDSDMPGCAMSQMTASIQVRALLGAFLCFLWSQS
jgi:hypothetical protein